MNNTDDLTLKDLEQYSGTEQYHKIFLFPFANLTDGVYYIINNGYSWFVTDVLSVIATDEKIRQEDFLSIKLKLSDDKTAVMEITDGNEKILYTQNYNYTDAKRELNLFYTNSVLLLSGEY
jgi:hypothetical protein